MYFESQLSPAWWHACNPCTQEAEELEFKASLVYLRGVRVILYFQKIVTYRGHKKGTGTTKNTVTFNHGQRNQVGQLFHTRSVMPYHGSSGLRDKRLSTHLGLYLLPKCLAKTQS